MSLPAWWPRVCCVYCGARVGEYDSHRPLSTACENHRRLVDLEADVAYSLPMHAAGDREAVTPHREREQ